MTRIQVYNLFIILNKIAQLDTIISTSIGYKILKNIQILRPIYDEIEEKKIKEINEYQEKNKIQNLKKKDYMEIEKNLIEYQNQEIKDINIYFLNLNELFELKSSIKDLQYLMLIVEK